MQGLCTDPTADSSDDDVQEAPLPDNALAQLAFGECGVRASVGMTAADETHMLQVSRSSGKVRASTSSVSHADVRHSDVPDIHPLLFALLTSVYESPGELSRVLRQDWVSDWEGWAEANSQFDVALCANDETKLRKSWLSGSRVFVWRTFPKDSYQILIGYASYKAIICTLEKEKRMALITHA